MLDDCFHCHTLYCENIMTPPSSFLFTYQMWLVSCHWTDSCLIIVKVFLSIETINRMTFSFAFWYDWERASSWICSCCSEARCPCWVTKGPEEINCFTLRHNLHLGEGHTHGPDGAGGDTMTWTLKHNSIQNISPGTSVFLCDSSQQWFLML